MPLLPGLPKEILDQKIWPARKNATGAPDGVEPLVGGRTVLYVFDSGKTSELNPLGSYWESGPLIVNCYLSAKLYLNHVNQGYKELPTLFDIFKIPSVAETATPGIEHADLRNRIAKDAVQIVRNMFPNIQAHLITSVAMSSGATFYGEYAHRAKTLKCRVPQELWERPNLNVVWCEAVAAAYARKFDTISSAQAGGDDRVCVYSRKLVDGGLTTPTACFEVVETRCRSEAHALVRREFTRTLVGEGGARGLWE